MIILLNQNLKIHQSIIKKLISKNRKGKFTIKMISDLSQQDLMIIIMLLNNLNSKEDIALEGINFKFLCFHKTMTIY